MNLRVVTHIFNQNAGSGGDMLAELGRRIDPGAEQALERYLLQHGEARGLASHDPHGAIFRQLLLTEGAVDVALVSDEAIERYLAQMLNIRLGDIPFGLRSDRAIRANFARVPSGSGILVPVATGLVLPSRQLKRDDRPIILGSAALEHAPRDLLSPASIEALFKDAADSASLDSAGSPAPGASVDDESADLSTALTACLMDERAQLRSDAGRRPTFGRQGLRAVAAALAAFAVISVVDLGPMPPGPSTKLAVAGAPGPIVDALPAPARPDRVVSLILQAGPEPQTQVPQAPATPPAAAFEKPRALPVKVATAEPAGLDVKVDDWRSGAGSAAHDEAPIRRAAVPTMAPSSMAPPTVAAPVEAAPVAAAPAGRAPAIVPLPAESSLGKTALGRTARRRSKKVMAVRRTSVALALPDVLKPQ